VNLRFCLFILVPGALLFGQSSPPPVPAYKPLSGAERWHRYWKDTILSPGLYFAATGAASGSQLAHDPPEWHQGAKGYARRSASLLGLFTIQETVAQAGAAALGYDPRYIQCECRGFFRRSGHAILWTFLTKNEQGSTRFNLPALAGAYGSGMLSTYWYPPRYNPLSDGVRVGNQQVGFDVGVNLIREFSPELKKFFRFGH